MSARQRPAAAPGEALTPARFERELKDLASKAQNDAQGTRATTQLAVYARAVVLLALLGIYSHASRLNLSPVYGSIPSSIWHAQLLMAGCFVGWAGNVAIRQLLPIKTAQMLPLVAMCVPAVQWFLFRYSGALGPEWGPAVTEALTLLPLAVLTAASVADHLDGAQLTVLPAFVADAAPGLGSWGLLKFAERLAGKHLQANMGRAVVYTRLGLELVLGALYAVAAPSRYLVYALPPLLHTLLVNTHVPSPAATSALVSSLMSDGWLLLERRESLTGYISVAQSVQDGYRVMRCDHSLLGGDWIQARGGLASEPIYGVFAMLEAVRLAETDKHVKDEDARALVVGLGVGTSPSAFVAHGINTTVVEIDPIVYELAVKYFDLKENNPPVLDDAVSYTSGLATTAPESYDYIIHDVFTGGAEPVELFTLEFLQGLSALLKPSGVIAINYAGDLMLPAPKVVFRTIKQVFPTCRVFREMALDVGIVKESGTDFTNIVIFCTKTTTPLTFRVPTTKDYLGSSAREEFLHLNHEISQAELLSGDDASILRKNDTSAVARWHEQSALGHWNIMRFALPAFVWERW